MSSGAPGSSRCRACSTVFSAPSVSERTRTTVVGSKPVALTHIDSSLSALACASLTTKMKRIGKREDLMLLSAQSSTGRPRVSVRNTGSSTGVTSGPLSHTSALHPASGTTTVMGVGAASTSCRRRNTAAACTSSVPLTFSRWHPARMAASKPLTESSTTSACDGNTPNELHALM